MGSRETEPAFAEFIRRAEQRLSFALAAAYGPDVGADATAEALGFAWEHWDRLVTMENPVGYLYRVGQSRARRYRRPRPPVCPPHPSPEPWVEPALPGALARLSRRQRVAVVLVVGFGWYLAEVADLLGVCGSSVQRHLDRGLLKLRASLGVDE